MIFRSSIRSAGLLRPWHLLRFFRAGRGIRIRTTRYGLVFIGGIAAMLFGAINWNNNLSFLLTFLLASLLIVSIPMTHRNLLPIDVRVPVPRPVFAGDMALIGVQLRSLTDCAAIHLSFSGTSPQLAEISGDRSVLVEIPFPTSRRGYLTPGPLTISSVYPLGLFEARRTIDHDIGLIVFPHPLEGKLPARPYSNSTGEQEGDRSPGGDDFDGLDRYQPGDPLSHIAWKAYSRGQGLQTKQFVSRQGRAILLDWSLLDPLDTELRLSRLCAGVLAADRRGIAYGLQLPGKLISPALGSAHRYHCLKALALWGLPHARSHPRESSHAH